MRDSSRLRLKVILLALVVLLFIGYLLIHNLYRFLSPNEPVNAQILVIEGWLPDFALKSVANEFLTNHHDLVITTGGPISRGTFLSEYKSYENLAKSTLKKITGKDNIVAVRAPDTKKDRTFASALALKKWLQENHISHRKISVVTLDIHARRTWILFHKALGKNYDNGIIAIDDIYYDENNWWVTSDGFRSTIDEAIAYIYVKTIFPFSDSVPSGD